MRWIHEPARKPEASKEKRYQLLNYRYNRAR